MGKPIQFASKGEEKKFQRWMAQTAFRNLLMYGVTDEGWEVDSQKMYELFLAEQQRRKEGWYASFDDVYGDLLAEFSGQTRARIPVPERWLGALRLYKENTRLGVSKIMLLAREEYPPALVRAAELFLSGRYLRYKPNLSLLYAQKAYALGYKPAAAILAFIKHNGLGVKKDVAEARNLMAEAIKADDPSTYKRLGYNCVDGVGLESPDIPRGEAYFRAACAAGDTSAADGLLWLVNNDLIEEPDDDTAVVPLLRKGAEQGDPDCTFLLAKLLFHVCSVNENLGDAVDDFLHEAAYCMLKAAKAEVPEAVAFFAQAEDIALPDGRTVSLPLLVEAVLAEVPEAVALFGQDEDIARPVEGTTDIASLIDAVRGRHEALEEKNRP